MVILTVVTESGNTVTMMVDTTPFRMIKYVRNVVKQAGNSLTYMANVLMDYDTLHWVDNDLPDSRVVADFNGCEVKWTIGQDVRSLNFGVFGK